MLNPSAASKSPLSSRIALSFALLLAGIFGLAVAILLPSPSFKKNVQQQQHAVNAIVPVSHTTTLEGMESSAPMAVSTEELVEFCSQHVSAKRSFVLFRRGTCVVVDEPCTDPLADARKRIAACAEADAPFVPEPTSEGDLIVAFKEPVFHRFTREELVLLSPWVDQIAPALLSPAESVAAGDDWTPHQNAKVGLLARRRLLEDASQLIPVKIIRAKTNAHAETAAR
ncbi:hypothetical protein OKA05_16010 [Luteolibacter arcticus]|uniref:Uncharacterized protein n=1 Tax=Luteolibacter arcticus TaxID=1581411 RepID=A0ABT3GKP9_9BACT|nr:hypothetical protein [Luteolibacter arcticus]MCW1924073.1 hypothetical protein [Luteolibacter arcticus]